MTQAPVPFDALDPRRDARDLIEAAGRIADDLNRTAATREARVRETADLATRVEQRFDAYDQALAATRRAKDASDNRARELEAKVEATLAEGEQALAEAGRRHHAHIQAMEEAHEERMRATDEAHRGDIERLRGNLDRLKEDMGLRYLRLEEENALQAAEIDRVNEENASLNRSIQILIASVEASARSMQDDDAALVAAMAGVRERTNSGDLASAVVVRLPQRPKAEDAVQAAPQPAPAQSRAAG